MFISSIINRGIEDLIAEREQVRSAVEHFAPATAAWAFEAEPASAKQLLDFYIDAVKTSDLFILVLGQHLTKPVQDEYNAARDHGKPILAFSKRVASRDANAEELLRTLDSKYDSFNLFGFRFAKPALNQQQVVTRINGKPCSWLMLREAALLYTDGWALFYDDDGRPVTYGAGYLYVQSGDA